MIRGANSYRRIVLEDERADEKRLLPLEVRKGQLNF
jgi:hypothetical protein